MTLLLAWMVGVLLIHLSENETWGQVSVSGERVKLSLRVSRVVSVQMVRKQKYRSGAQNRSEDSKASLYRLWQKL